MTRQPTAFETRIYNAVCRIAVGKVTTYRLLGETVGCRSSQAVGGALKRNPYAPEVPCHRVISTDRTIGGFAGARGGDEITKKRRLLEAEGIVFDSGDQIAADSIVALEASADDELSLVIAESRRAT